jgi:hypothetical protein
VREREREREREKERERERARERERETIHLIFLDSHLVAVDVVDKECHNNVGCRCWPLPWPA